MVKGNKQNTSATTPEEIGSAEYLKRISNLLALIATKELNTTERILMLNSIGFNPGEIADLLGTTRNTVSVRISEAKKKRRTK